jgi:hypothetical protein
MKRYLTGLWILFFLAACSSAPARPAQVDPPFPAPNALAAEGRVYALESGWFDGQAVSYYNLGANASLNPADPERVLVMPAWLFITGTNPDGSPIKLTGQGTVFNINVGVTGYSDLWQISFVTPPADYQPDSLKSIDALQASGMTIEKQAMLVNCPLVPAGATLGDKSKEALKGWVNNQPVFYFDFGVTSAKPGQVYAFVTGFNSDGSPQLVAGQHFIFDSARASGGYSDFRGVQWVTVGASYPADSIRAVKDIDPSRVTASTLVVNYPQK